MAKPKADQDLRRARPSKRFPWAPFILGGTLAAVLLAVIVKALTPWEPRYVAPDARPCAEEYPWIEGKRQLALSIQASAEGDGKRALAIIDEAEKTLERAARALPERLMIHDTAALYSEREQATARGDWAQAAKSARAIFQSYLNGYRSDCGLSTEYGWKPQTRPH